MKINSYYIDDDGRLIRVEVDEALESWRGGTARHWIDIQTEDFKAMLEWLEGLGLDPNLIDSLKKPDSTGRVIPFPEAVFFEFPIPLATGEIALTTTMALPGLVLTFHQSPDEDLEGLL